MISKTQEQYTEYLRHEDVQVWVDQNPTEKWVAIDDLPMHQLREHYVGTDPTLGLTDANVQQAVRVLNS